MSVHFADGMSHDSSSDNYPYASSVSSSASSSSSSIFSVGLSGSQGSSVSSSASFHSFSELEGSGVYPSGSSQSSTSEVPSRTCRKNVHKKSPFPCSTVLEEPQLRLPGLVLPGAPLPAEQRQNPRRSSGCATALPPPLLVRQNDRKVNFVDNLVDSAAQIVEAIWPLSVVACQRDSSLGSKGVLPLRTFIQETLRRSRTSYSTLQVALYYLIVVRPHVPKHDFTMEQPADCPANRALQCGRRMFLAALILASKYLQDRNYSARAWSKISGLNTQEINMNEISFLSAVGWRLHISERVFQRWTDIVLKYTSSTPPSSPTAPGVMIGEDAKPGWNSIISKLTPELDAVEIGETPSKMPLGCVYRLSEKSQSDSAKSLGSDCFDFATSQSTTTAPHTSIPPPRPMEPQAHTFDALLQPLPSLRRMAPLPTPQLTPAIGFGTPAASFASFCGGSRRPSLGSAMAQAASVSQNMAITRCSLDRWPAALPQGTCQRAETGDSFSFASSPAPISSNSLYRRSSLAQSTCSLSSSPESMVSDNSSRSSRSSSISSVSSSMGAPNPAKLAVQATCRSAKLQLQGQKDSLKKLICITSGDDFSSNVMMDFTPSPDSYSACGSVPDFSNFSLSTPQLTPTQPSFGDSGRGTNTSVLRDSSPSPRRSSAHSKGRKRGRGSDDLSSLQRQVRKLVSCSETIAEDAVMPDAFQASSFLLPTVNPADIEVKAMQLPSSLSPHRLALQREMGRKRACCGDEAPVFAARGGRVNMGAGGFLSMS